MYVGSLEIVEPSSSQDQPTGAKPVDKSGQAAEQRMSTPAQRIWDTDWVLRQPELALRAIESLQQRVEDLEEQIKRAAQRPEKWRMPVNHPDCVLLSSLPPDTRFLLVRSGDFFTTTGRKNKYGRHIQLRDDGKEVTLHGSCRVQIFPPL